MRSASGRRVVTGLLIAGIAVGAWWLVSRDRTLRVEPLSSGAERSESESERSGNAPTSPAATDAPVASDRSLDVERSRSASSRRLLHGFVVDRAGKKVDGAQIAWSENAALPPVNDYKRRITAAGGEYGLGGLPASDVGFRVTATGCATLEVALDLSKGGTLRHDFVLDRSVIVAVYVRKPDGTTVQGLLTPSEEWDAAFLSLAVVATDEPIASLPPISEQSYERQGVGREKFHHRPSRGPRSAVEVPDGAFGVLELPRLPLEATLLFKHVVVDQQRIQPGAASVTFTFDPAQIDRWTAVLRLTVISAETDEAIVGARVDVRDSQGSGAGATVVSDGTFEQRRIPPGWMAVTIDGTGHTRWYRNILFEPGVTLDLGEIELPNAINLTGTLVDRDGKPAMASFAALPLDAYVPGQSFGEFNYPGMEKAGEWQIQQLGPGRYQLHAFGESDGSPRHSQRAWRVVDVVESPSPIALTLQPMVKVVIDGGFATAGTATAPLPGGSFDDCIVDLVRSDGFVADAGRRTLRAPVEFQLLAGSYVCAVRRASRLVRTVPFDVGEQPLRVFFRLDDERPPEITLLEPTAVAGLLAQPPTAAIEDELGIVLQGRVVDQADAVVDGARVSAIDAAGKRVAGVIAADGGFVIAALQPGSHKLQASADGCRPANAEVEIAANVAPATPKLVLRRMTRLKVAFEDLAGGPLSAAYERRFPISQFEHDITLVATRAPPPDSWHRSSFSLGSWKPEWKKCGGTLDLRELPPLAACVVFAGRVIASLPIEPGMTELRFVIDPARFDEQLATLRFRLVDAITGEPITRASTGLCGMNGFMSSDPSSAPEQPDGVHLLVGQLPGRRKLCIATSGGAAAQLVVDLPAGSTLDLGDVELLEAIELHGIVVDEAGAPLATEVRIISYDTAGEAQLDGAHFVTECDAAGRFTLQASQPWIRLQVRPDDCATTWSRIDVAKAAIDGAEIRLVTHRGQQVTLQPSPGDDVQRRVEVRTADGELLGNFALDGAEPRRFQLLPGDYRLVIERDGADAKEIAFSVGDAPATIELP